MNALFADLELPFWVFALSIVMLVAAVTLAGLARVLTRARGQVLHVLCLVHGGIALGVLALLALRVDPGPGAVVGMAAAFAAFGFWLLGAAVARVRPVWVDLLVIVAGLAFLTAYALAEEGRPSIGAAPASAEADR